ncbi:geraniol 8-hydroxylase-like [Rhododendron vialii]|uniref:geraniol 8-hydroxylase-like n=1 Tax=Rhododendron vialii TaxID=182163 RepID=UPI0026604EA0|nr:geraniol 8-hydroxylase-like [Rhododendron vialii]
MEFLSLILYLLLTIILLQVLHSLLTRTRTRSNLPPGPGPLPIVGNLLKLGDMPHKSLAELAKTHGPIMSLKLGQITTVVISSSALAKEVLQKQDLAFSTRSIPNALHAEEQYKYSVVWLPVSDRWRSLRKIMNSNIFSGSRLDANQNLRQQKVKELIAYAGKCCQDGVAVDIGSAAFTTSLNLLSNTVFSVDLAGLSQESAREFRDLATNITMEAGKPNLVDYFPVLAKIDPQGIRGRMTVHFRKMLQLFGGLIDERLKSRKLQKTNAENDVIDNLLNLGEDIDRTHIERMFVDLFVAGTDTTSSTIEWAMAELLHNPEILEKAKAELEQTIGKGKLIQESDILRLPYLRATVKETMRIHPSVPFLIPRKVETDVEVYGYTVPKGAQVLVNAWAIGRDPSIWKNPTTFMPARFLESEVDVRGQDFELIPFGAGRRICPGLPLAMRMVPMVLGSLVNSFDWKLEGGIAPGELDMEEKFGITLQKAQPMRAIPFHM